MKRALFDPVNTTLRGGRVTKFKGQVASYAPHLGSIGLALPKIGVTAALAASVAIGGLTIGMQDVQAQTVGLDINPRDDDGVEFDADGTPNNPDRIVLDDGSGLTLNSLAVAGSTNGNTGSGRLGDQTLVGGVTDLTGLNNLTTGGTVVNTTYTDPVTGTLVVVRTYDNTNIVEGAVADSNVSFFENVNDQIYNRTRLAEISHGTLTVDYTTTNPNMVAKSISLFNIDTEGVDNPAEIVWESQNNFTFNGSYARAVPGSTVTTNRDTVEYAGTITDAAGNSFTINNLADLQAYNTHLQNLISSAVIRSEAEYIAEFEKAYSIVPIEVEYVNAEVDPNDEVTLTWPEHLLFNVRGATAAVTVTNTADISFSGTGARLFDDAQFVVEEEGAFRAADAITLSTGADARNDGLVTGRNVFRASGAGTTAENSATGTIVVNSTGSGGAGHGFLLEEGATGTNAGDIIVGVNNLTGTSAVQYGARVVSGTFDNSGDIYLGYDYDEETGVATPLDAALQRFVGIELNDGTATNTGIIRLGDNVVNAVGMSAIDTDAGDSLINDGTIEILSTERDDEIEENIGILAQDSGDATVEHNGTIGVFGLKGIGIKVLSEDAPATVAADAESEILVYGIGSLTDGARNYGVWVEGEDAVGDIDTTVIMGDAGFDAQSGTGSIGVHARNGGTVNLGATSDGVVFENGTDQIGYFFFGEGAEINGLQSTLDVSTERSTLFRFEDGADYVNSGTLTASGIDSRIFHATGDGTEVDTGAVMMTVSGEGALGFQVDDSASGTIAAGATMTLEGNNTIGALVDGRQYDIFENIVDPTTGNNASLINEGAIEAGAETPGVTGIIAQIGVDVENTATGSINLQGNADDTSIGIIARDGASVQNDGEVTVANGTGILVEDTELDGDAPTLTGTGSVEATDGIAGIHVRNTTLNGEELTATITGDGTAHGVLVGEGTTGVTLGGATINSRDTGNGIENLAEIADISLTGTTINASGTSAGIRTATQLDDANTATINVTDQAIGFAFQDADGATVDGDITLVEGYQIIGNGTGAVGFFANTTGTVVNQATIAMGENDDAAMRAGTATSSTNEGDLSSANQDGTVVDLSNGTGTTFTNVGTIAGASPTAMAVTGSTGDDTINLDEGMVTGIVGTDAGMDTVNLAGGQLQGTLDTGADNDLISLTGTTVDGTIEAGSGDDVATWTGGSVTGINMGEGDDSLDVTGVSLEGVTHIDGGSGDGDGKADIVTFNDVQFNGGSFGVDDAALGVNLRSGWDVINLTNGSELTLVDDLTLDDPELNIDATSTLFVGGGAADNFGTRHARDRHKCRSD